MGSVAAGLASVGGSLAQAKELQRQEQIERIKLALEQSRLEGEKARTGIEQRYADIAGMREKRLAADLNKPYNLQWKLQGNNMILAGQNPDGSPFVKSFPLNPEIGYQLKALQDEISQAPPEAQPILNSMVASDLAEGDITKAAKDIGPVMQALAKSKIAPDTETVRTGTQSIPLQIPGYPFPVVVQVPTTTTTRKVAAGRGEGAPSPADTSEALEQIPAPVSSGVTDYPGAPRSVPAPQLPNIPLPPGSRILGFKPPPGTKATGQLKPEMQAGLRVLHVSLWGTATTPGLDSTIGVLDSKVSRAKLIAAGVGSSPNPNQWAVSKLAQAGFYTAMTDAERKYVYQLNRAVSAINALRSITGLPRSTQVLMDRYVLELPNPVTTPSSKDARNQLQLIEREIQAAMEDATTGTSLTPGAPPIPMAPSPSGPALPPDAIKALDNMFGPAKPR